MEEKKLISIIVPCYNEQEVLPMFYKEITKVSASMQAANPELEFEYLFIDDGSKDRTLRTLRIMAKYDKRVRYISFSRNFGKEAGIYAGLSNAKGDYCVVMDADLQHPPKFLPEMYAAVSSGEYDCATTRRVSRDGESKVRSCFARLFYKLMNHISQTEIVDGAQDFRFMSRQMVDAVLSMSEYNRFSKGIFSWVGFRVKYLEYENVERAAGKSAWSFWGLFGYSLEGIIGFSTAPLTATAAIGFISCLIGLILLVFTICKRLIIGGDPLGYPTTTCCVVFFGGLQVFCTGILGLYLGKTYLEVKHRPIYLVRETEETADKFPEPKADETEDADSDADDDAAEARTAEADETAKKLEKAKRIKQEADEEFNAIVDAAFADDAADTDDDASEDAAEDEEDADESETGEDEYEDDEEDDEDEYEDDEEDDEDEYEDGEEDDEDEYEDSEEDDEDEYEDGEEDDDDEYEDDEEDDDDEYEDDEDEDEDEDDDDADDAAEKDSVTAEQPKKEKFEVKIDYDSIDFDDDYDDVPAKRRETEKAAGEKQSAKPAQSEPASDDASEDFADDAAETVSAKKKSRDDSDGLDEDMAFFEDEPSFAERAGGFFSSLKEKLADLKDSIVGKLQHDPLEDEEFAALAEELDDDFDDDFDDLHDDFSDDAEDETDDADDETDDADDAADNADTRYTAKHADDDFDETDDDFDEEEDDSTYKGAHF